MRYAAATLGNYITDAASNKPAPGGGSVSALAGALAAAMSEMAANFTTGKEKYADVEQQVSRCLERLEQSRRRLIELVDEDVEAYGALNEAYSMPRATEQEQTERREAIQEALRGALEVPLNIMRECGTVSETAAELVGIANPNLLTDVGVSAILAEAACASAKLNVEINLKFMKDPGVGANVRPEMAGITVKATRCRQQVSQHIRQHLSQ